MPVDDRRRVVHAVHQHLVDAVAGVRRDGERLAAAAAHGTAPVGVMVPPAPALAVMVNCGPMMRLLELDATVIVGMP